MAQALTCRAQGRPAGCPGQGLFCTSCLRTGPAGSASGCSSKSARGGYQGKPSLSTPHREEAGAQGAKGTGQPGSDLKEVPISSSGSSPRHPPWCPFLLGAFCRGSSPCQESALATQTQKRTPESRGNGMAERGGPHVPGSG